MLLRTPQLDVAAAVAKLRDKFCAEFCKLIVCGLIIAPPLCYHISPNDSHKSYLPTPPGMISLWSKSGGTPAW